MRQSGRKKPPKISINRSPCSMSNNSLMSPTDVKAKNTGLFVSVAQHHVASSSCAKSYNIKILLLTVKVVGNISMREVSVINV